jgi:lipopolysaccharide/colanic/teichoic acid biosynthesis glycosyltransferase
MFDCLASLGGLLVLSPLLILAAALVRMTSPGPVLFCQERVGRGFRRFRIFKFRSMVVDAPQKGSAITVGRDPRITAVGHILRATKIDELPQLVNVLKGDMSFVGPRPEVPKYVEQFRQDYQEILQVRPGITDLASIEYRDEAAVLAMAEVPEREYVERVLPEKIRLAKDYIRRQSLWFDLKIILITLWRLLADRLPSSRECAGHSAKPASSGTTKESP